MGVLPRSQVYSAPKWISVPSSMGSIPPSENEPRPVYWLTEKLIRETSKATTQLSVGRTASPNPKDRGTLNPLGSTSSVVTSGGSRLPSGSVKQGRQARIMLSKPNTRSAPCLNVTPPETFPLELTSTPRLKVTARSSPVAPSSTPMKTSSGNGMDRNVIPLDDSNLTRVKRTEPPRETRGPSRHAPDTPILSLRTSRNS